jgi:tetratricopeptide (TPR) repeat protein
MRRGVLQPTFQLEGRMRSLILAIPLLLLAGCSDDGRVATLEGKLNNSVERINEVERQNEKLALELIALRKAVAESSAPPPDPAAIKELEALRARLQAAEGRITSLEAAPEPGPDLPEPEPVRDVTANPPDAPTDTAGAAKTPLAKDMRRLEELMPLIKSDVTGEQVYELVEIAEDSNKAFRDEVISRMRDWVKAEPENSRARLGLALALTTRFRDIRGDMMKQATLAGEVRKEAEKASEIDPEYYDAVHFMAILKVNYPTFAQEFQGAKEDLDKALEMQAQLPWDDAFCEIYAAYSLWYRKQGKLDDAMTKVNAGLQKSPQHKDLLNEKKAIEDRKTGEGD